MKLLTRLFAGTFAITVCLGALHVPVQAQEKMSLSLENADIRKLIDWAKDSTDKSIIIHPNVKGKVSVVAGNAMSKDEAYQVFLSVLQVHGFAAIETDSALKIIPDAIAKQTAIPLLRDGAPDEDLVVHLVKLKNISAIQMVNILRPLVPQVGHLAASPESNVIIIADRANNIDKMLQIVERMDQTGGVDIEVIKLEYASARDVLDMIRELMSMSNQGANAATAGGVKFSADERSNSILLTGDPASRTTIKQLIARLDQPLEGEGNTQVFFLNYAIASDLAPILESVSGSVIKSENNQANADVEVSIQPNDTLNALVITAPPALLNTMKGVIAKLDVRRAQVLVEALIVEVSEGLVRDLGVDWATAVNNDSGAIFGNGLNPTITSNDDNTTVNPAPFVGANGLSLGYFSGNDLRALVRILASDSNSNILSTPTIMALDNEEAEILVGENVPFITGEDRAVGSNQNPFQTIQRRDIGTSLKIKPRINNDNSVTLEIEQKTEDLKPSSNASDVITSKREIKTRVLIGNGEVLVLGGLITDKVTETENKVPLLGDIPVLGNAFKSTRTETTKTNLMVFIHPIILRDPKSGIEVTRDRYNMMHAGQEAFRDNVESFFLPGGSPQLQELPSDQFDLDTSATAE